MFSVIKAKYWAAQISLSAAILPDCKLTCLFKVPLRQVTPCPPWPVIGAATVQHHRSFRNWPSSTELDLEGVLCAGNYSEWLLEIDIQAKAVASLQFLSSRVVEHDLLALENLEKFNANQHSWDYGRTEGQTC